MDNLLKLPMDEGLSRRLTVARTIARAVGREVEALQAEARLDVSRKGFQDFVTVADRRSEEIIRTRLNEAFPDDGFIGEETGGEASGREFWVVDPIDGTSNYIRGLRHWAVSIAFVREGQIEIGCIYDSTSAQVYSAARGQGAYREGHRISIANRNSAAEGLAILGYSRRTGFDEYQAIARKLYDLGMDYRRLGSAAVGLVRVANGVADLYYEGHLNCWDVMAGVLIAREAGAVVKMPPMETMLARGGSLVAYTPGLDSELAFLGGGG
jgi:myo-inositol-1(or 4)-monophosphatase